MTLEAFDRALKAYGLLPQALLQHAAVVSSSMDDRGREQLMRAIQQEYSQYVPLVQRKLERIEHAIADVETRMQPKTVRKPSKEQEANAALVRQMNGMLA
jgi:hypothetical protein